MMTQEIEKGFLGGIRLANGKELERTNSAAELCYFFESNGASITPGKSKKGGKSKGARNKGRKGVKRTAAERG